MLSVCLNATISENFLNTLDLSHHPNLFNMHVRVCVDFDSSNKYPVSYHSISEAVLSLGGGGSMSYQVFLHAA